MNFVKFFNGSKFNVLNNSIYKELEVPDSERTTIQIVGSSDREEIRDSWSNLPEQGFSLGFTNLWDFVTRFANFNNVSVVFCKLFK